MLSTHAAWFTQRFGETKPEYFPIPFAKPKPNDPTRPITDLSGSWSALRERAGVKCRLHDLRHTAATKMCEAGVPDSTMLARMGHMSRAMLERYSPHTDGGRGAFVSRQGRTIQMRSPQNPPQ